MMLNTNKIKNKLYKFKAFLNQNKKDLILQKPKIQGLGIIMIKNKKNIFLHLEILYQKVQNLPYIKANMIHIEKSYKKIKMKHKIYPKKKIIFKKQNKIKFFFLLLFFRVVDGLKIMIQDSKT